MPDLTEKQWLRQVTDLAHLYRWRTFHPWLSIRSERGWPDLALVRPPRLVLAELKTDHGKVTLPQQEWLDLLGACSGVEVHLWRPSDFNDLVEVLR
jgi:hypothetical protein